MLIFISWIALAVIIGVVASKRGRFGLGWFLLTLVVSPLVTAPLLLVLPRRYFEAQTASATAGGGAVLAAAKGTGVTVLIGGLILFVLFVVALIAIVQHGGA